MPHTIDNLVLGKIVDYFTDYNPNILCPVPRALNRYHIVKSNLDVPFFGYDIWTAYELSYLNKSGKPECLLGALIFPYDTKNIIESKSLKLYLNSLSESKFESEHDFIDLISKDLSSAAEGKVSVKTFREEDFSSVKINKFEGVCIDKSDIEITAYTPDKKLLSLSSNQLKREALYTNLFKSVCPVTSQPDWASIWISYSGKAISIEGLLKYLVSYRTHSGFHECCVESIFCDIMDICSPELLTVYARFTRRGGLDINPIRTNDPEFSFPDLKKRLFRQ